MARTILYGMRRSGEVLHSETLRETDTERLRSLAEERLKQFETVEVWVESVRVVRLRR